MNRLVVAIVALTFGAALHAQPDSQVARIVIRAAFTGISKTTKETTSIERAKNGFRRDHKDIDSHLVDDFMNAVTAPALAAPDLQNLGLGGADNSRLADKAWPDSDFSHTWVCTGEKRFTPPESARSLFFQAFTDERALKRAVGRSFAVTGVDFYPSFEIAITHANRRMTRVYSTSYSAYMLPWHIERDGQRLVTDNADISRALAALLPEHALIRGVIGEDYFTAGLATTLSVELEDAHHELIPCGR
jgi:hypothetical protein